MGFLAIAGTLFCVIVAIAATWAATYGLEMAARREKQAREEEFLNMIKEGK